MTSMIGLSGTRGPSGRSAGETITGGNVIPKGFERGQLTQFTPEQMNLFKQLFSQTAPESFLSRLAGGDQGMFQQLEAPAMKQFQGLLGNIGSRFSGMGMGARHGSGFQNSLNQATSDFGQALQSQRLGLQRQALQDLLGISGSLLQQRPFEQFLSPKKKSFLEELGGSLSGGLGQLLGLLPLLKMG